MNWRRERVLAALRKQRGRDGVIRTTYARTARIASFSVATIGREIAALKADGLLAVVPHATLYGRGKSEYLLTEPAEPPVERVQRPQTSKPTSKPRKRAQRRATASDVAALMRSWSSA